MFKILLYAFALSVALTIPAVGADRTWDRGAGTDNWLTAINWSADTLPTSADRVIINMANGPRIAGGSASSGELRLGTTALGTGALTIGPGGALTGITTSYIGYASNATGMMTVTGPGAVWTLANISGVYQTLIIGQNSSTGSLTVSNGGLVNAAQTLVANSVGSTGTLVLTGANSALNANAEIRIGHNGVGTVNILDGAVLTTGIAAGNSSIGTTASGSGTVLIDGAGSRWQTSRSILLGSAGTGIMTVRNGGMLGASSMTIGSAATSTGALTVDGADSFVDINGLMLVGDYGSGDLTVRNGGTIITGISGSASSFIGYRSNASPASKGTGNAIVDGAGSSWTSRFDLNIGNLGNGTLSVQNGGYAQSLRATNIGSGAGSLGLATITGAGSRLDAVGIRVGHVGNGTLIVENGAEAISSSFVTVGRNPGSTGQMTIRTGGKVESLKGELGWIGGNGNVLITDSGSAWAVGTDLFIGATDDIVNSTPGQGTVTVQNGADLSVAGTIYIGSVPEGATPTGNGMLNVGADPVSAATAAGTVHASQIAFGVGGALNFNHTDTDYQFAIPLIGPGAVNFIQGNTILTGDMQAFTGSFTGGAAVALTGSRLTIASDSSAFSGTTFVRDAGVLVLSDQLGGTVDVAGGGRLQGNGSAGDVIVNDGGTAAPGNSIGTLNTTNIIFNSGSTYEVEVNAAGASDLVNASGTATINGGTVRLIPYPDYLSGYPYRFLTAAGGLSGTFDGIAEDFLFLQGDLTYDSNNAYLSLAADADAITDVAETANQLSVARGLLGGPIDGAASAPFIVLANAASARAALNSLSGEIHAATRNILLDDQSSLGRTILGQAQRNRMVDGSDRAWIVAENSDRALDGNGNTASVDRSRSGFLTGAEHGGDGWFAGVATGASRSHVALDARQSKADITTYQAAGYAGMMAGPALRFTAGASYAYHVIDSNRRISFGSIDQSDRAHSYAQSEQVFGELALPFAVTEDTGMTITPYLQGDIVMHQQGKAREGGEAGVTADSMDSVTASTTAGITAKREWRALPASGALSAGIGWRHAYGDNDAARSMRLNQGGTSFSVQGADPARDKAVLDLDLTAHLSKSTDLDIGYAGAVGRDDREHAFQLRLSVRF